MFRDQRKYGRDPAVVVRCSPATFNAPLSPKWGKLATAALEDDRPHLVFTCSWSDWFHADADPWREEAWDVIRRTPEHTYLILTKRHGRIARCLPADWGDGWPNVWLGVSVETNEYLGRIDVLRGVPVFGARRPQRFVSAEPLLGPLNLGYQTDGIGWVIIGGESGVKSEARPMHPAWAREVADTVLAVGQRDLDEAFAAGAPDTVIQEGIRDEASARGRPLLHMKQWGSWAPVRRDVPRVGDELLGVDGKRIRIVPDLLEALKLSRGPGGEYLSPVGSAVVRYAGPDAHAGGKILDGHDYCERPGLP